MEKGTPELPGRRALKKAGTRTAFGWSLWHQQVIRQRISMLEPKVRAAQFMDHCVWGVAQGQTSVQDVSMLKALSGELVNEVVHACQQLHSGMGYIRDTAIKRLWRDAQVLPSAAAPPK